MSGEKRHRGQALPQKGEVDLLVGGYPSDSWPHTLIELAPRLRANLRPTYTMKNVEFIDRHATSNPFPRDGIRVA